MYLSQIPEDCIYHRSLKIAFIAGTYEMGEEMPHFTHLGASSVRSFIIFGLTGNFVFINR